MKKITSFSSAHFLQKYWEKAPAIIQDLLPSDNINLDMNEVAGLALEDEVISRLIQFKNNEIDKLCLDFGPFSEEFLVDLDELTPWTLLVQNVEKYIESAQHFVNLFDFLPNEFFDDVMGSISSKNGTTGPHLDWYSVFIIQLEGQKDWKVEKNKRSYYEHDNNLHEELDLKILKDFRDHHLVTLAPGDTLYIPPGHGHWGTATEKSFSVSLGFQGPRLVHLIEEYIKKLISKIPPDERVSFVTDHFISNNKLKLDLKYWPKEIIIKDDLDPTSLIQKAKKRDL